LFLAARQPADLIVHQASKTTLVHRWPVPAWLRNWMQPVNSPLLKNTLHFRKVLLFELAKACDAAGVPVVTPKQFRQLSITEWTSANATAGAIVHGSGLGVMAHYLDKIRVLESAMHKVKVPACLQLHAPDNETTLLNNFRRMDPTAQQIISTTAERLAAG
jgi:hypothetical protein